MLKLVAKIKDIKDSNLVFLLESKNDIKLLDELNLDQKINIKIEEIIKSDKNQVSTFFLGEENFEYIFIIFYSSKSTKTLIEFLWEEIPKLPSKLSLLTNSEVSLISLLDTTLLSRYKFNKYKSEKEEDLISVLINKNSEELVKNRLKTLENIILARDLWETPSSDLFPESFATLVKNTKFENVKVKIFDSKQVEKEWLLLLHNVWKGSSKWPYMVIMERIIDKSLPIIWIVWKGITFDTWWIQVKPGDHMYEMKWDMCWAASVYTIMKELDDKKLNINIVACLVLAENHISWNSYKPSDIIKSYSWKTVDIIHTDAEWRLVLADWVSYISKNYKLDKVITIATLTWAVMVALWYRYAWIMWNDKKLIKKFIDYSKDNFEKYIELPFDNYFIEKTRASNIADLENLNRWVYAWSSMWAAFLSNFILNNETYVHLDIAWTAINWFEAYWLFNKWMTWFWVDSLSSILMDMKQENV